VLQRLKNLSLPSVYWGPAVVKHRLLVNYVDGFEIDPWTANGLMPSIGVPTSQVSSNNVINSKDIQILIKNDYIYMDGG